MIPLLAVLCGGAMVFSMLAQVQHSELSDDRPASLVESYRSCGKLLFFLIGSSLLNQAASAFSCRPIEILNDLRFFSMLSIQLGGFVLCLAFSFILGVQSTLLGSR